MGLFPSASLGWRISKEAFMESASNWLDDLKYVLLMVQPVTI